MKKYPIYLFLFLSLLLCFPINTLEAKAGLDRPTHPTVSLKRNAAGEYTHMELSWRNPGTVQAYLKEHPAMQVEVDVKKNGDPWHSQSKKALMVKPLGQGTSSTLVLDDKSFESIKEFNVFQSNYSFRLRYRDGEKVSPFSSEVRIGLRPVLKNVSPWAQPLLNKASKLGLIPNAVKEDLKAPITREEFAHALILAYEQKQEKVAPLAEQAFQDADQSYILKARELGFISGVGNNVFQPKGNITREQMAVMTEKFYSSLGLNGSGKAQAFLDEGSISPWAKPSVHKISSLGLIKGYQNKFNPKDTTSREEALSVIYRILELDK